MSGPFELVEQINTASRHLVTADGGGRVRR